MSESISSVASQRHGLSCSSSRSYTHPVQAQTSFCGKRFRNSRRSGRSARWFGGSNGSPPRSERPWIQTGSHAASTCSCAATVHGLPARKSQVSGLKQPGQQCVQPLTKTDTRTPGPFATSHVLIAE